MTLPTIYTSMNQSEEARELLASGQVLQVQGDQFFVITDPASYETGIEYRAQLQKLIKDLDEKRLELTSGARATVDKVNKEAKAAAAPWITLRTKVDDGLLAYQKELKRQEAEARKAEEARQAEEAKRAEEALEEERQRVIAANELEGPEHLPEEKLPTFAEAAAPEPASSGPAKGSAGSTASFVDVWKWDLENIYILLEAVKEDPSLGRYLKDPSEWVNRAELTKTAKADKEEAKVPGVVFYNEPAISTRVAS